MAASRRSSPKNSSALDRASSKSSADWLKQLKSAGKEGTAKIYARHGAEGEIYGVSYADMKAMLKGRIRSMNIAQELWDTEIHEARVIACQLFPIGQPSLTRLEAMTRQVSDYICAGALAGLIAEHEQGGKLAQKLVSKRGEWPSSIGHTALASLALNGQLSIDEMRSELDFIESNIKSAKNRTRHNMNQALISIGGTHQELRKRALEVAKNIAKVEVDHGETGCKTPDAASYIAKMVAHRAAKKSS